MKTPKYRFLLGDALRQIEALITAGYYRDLQTGQLTADPTGQWYSTTGYVTTVLDPQRQRFVLTMEKLANGSYLSLYGEGGSYLGSVDLSNSYLRPLPLPENTMAIAVTMGAADYDAVEDFSNLVYLMLEVSPFYSTLGKTVERQSEQMFFREVLNTDLHFVGREADALLSIGNTYLGRRFVLACQREESPTIWTTYHVDTFTTMDCQFDAARHICTPTLTPLDRYTKMIARQSNEYDLIKLNPAITQIETSLRPIIEIYEKGSGVITRFLGGTYWETEVSGPIDDDTVLTDTEHFSRVLLSDDKAHINVVEVYAGYESFIPKQEYLYDPNNNYYVFSDGQDTYTWSFVMLLDGFFQHPFLRLEKNGSPVTYGARQILVKLPQRVQSASDLPVDFGYSTLDIYGYEPSLQQTDLPMGKVTANLYDIWIRVVGNSDMLFGVAAFDLPKDDFAVDSPAYKKCAPLGKDQGFFYITDDTTTEPTEFGITENEGEYYTRENLPMEGGITGVKPMPVGKYEWGAFSFWYNYDENYTTQEAASRHDYLLKDCFTLGSVLKVLLREMDKAVTFKEGPDFSQFLYGSVPTNMTSDYRWQLALTQKSNVLKGDYDQPAQKAPITFEGLMGMLREQYGLYWYIDDNGYLRIEHKLYFLNGGSYIGVPQVQLDFTGSTLKDKFNKKRTAYFQNAFSYETSLFEKRLEMNTAENGTEFFTGLSIDFKAPYANLADTQSVNIGDFTSDLDLMRIEPSRYSQDGFTLLAYETRSGHPKVEVQECKVIDHESDTRVAFVNNLFASWVFCQHLHLYDATCESIGSYLRLDALSTPFHDIVRGLVWAKRQEIQFPSDQDPDTLQLIKTDVGSGMPERFEINALTRQVKATLAFPIGILPN